MAESRIVGEHLPVIEERHPEDSLELPSWRDSSEDVDEMLLDNSQASSPANQNEDSGDLDYANSAPQTPLGQVSDHLFVSEDSEDTELEDTPGYSVSDRTKIPAKKREEHGISKKDASRSLELSSVHKKGQKKIRNERIISDEDYEELCTVDYIEVSRENAALDPVLDSDLADKRKAMDEIIASVPDADKLAAKLDAKLVLDASRKYRGRVKHVSGKWKVKGLKTTLFHYQLSAGAWIIERESQDKPRGGLLCHQMGLGKTLIMLAVIHNERQSVNDKKPAVSEPAIGPTLIVAPSTLVTHWVQEITRHCDAPVRFVRHDSKSRTDRQDVSAYFQEQQIVITTYHQVTASYPFLKCPDELGDQRDVKEWWGTTYDTKLGPFHKVDWHRIILDEGQAIRNRNVKASIAVRALGGQRRWVVTGTPLVNFSSDGKGNSRAAEIYTYLEFLRVADSENLDAFKLKYSNGPGKDEKLRNLVQQFMLRKTHKSRLFGAPLLELPKITEEKVTVDLCSAEAFIHGQLTERFVEKVNGLVDDPERQKSCIFELITKERMFISHLLVAQSYIEKILNDRVMAHLKSLANEEFEIHDPSAKIARLLVSMVEEITIHAQLPAVNVDGEPERLRPKEDLSLILGFQDLMHGLSVNKDYLGIIQRKNCAMCGNPSHYFFLASCHHRYCKKCFAILPDEHGNTDTAGRKCLGCNKQIKSIVFCYDSYGSKDSSPEGTVAAASPCRKRSNVTDEASEREVGKKRPRMQNEQLIVRYQKWEEDRRRSRETGGLENVSNFPEVEPELEAEQKLDWIEKIGSLTPGAKHTAVQKQIQTWLANDKDAKIVVFVEFLGSIRLLQYMCVANDWKYATISGKTSIRARETEVERFRKRKDVKVLIATMKTGGIGLNLTMANKCIICDQWWNAAMEQQAYCRLHRLGQQREVEYVKIVANNTIDAHIMRLQQKKTKEINQLLVGNQIPENEMIKELLSYFGDVSEREGGGLWISSRPKHA